MQAQTIIETQLAFYRQGKAGCLFAAHAAGDPAKYGWRLSLGVVNEDDIEQQIESAILDEGISTQSIIFPSVVTVDDLINFLLVLEKTPSVHLEQEEEVDSVICLGYRVQVGMFRSWVTGFGNFDFLPKTRQATFTEIVFRSKPRPDYKKIMKQAPPGVIHLADMDMQGMSENKFKSLWYGSLDNTESRLGYKPDLRSAAKTTLVIPREQWQR